MVEIIPKPAERESAQSGYLFFFSIFFLVATLTIYLVFLSLQKKAEASLQNLQERLEKEETTEIRSLKTVVQDYEKKIKDIEPLLKNHIFSSKFFEELEKNTHPQIFFQRIETDFSNLTATLEGKSGDFFTLGQQVLILEKNPLISETKLEQLNVGKEGMVDFVLKFNFSPEIIKLKLE